LFVRSWTSKADELRRDGGIRHCTLPLPMTPLAGGDEEFCADCCNMITQNEIRVLAALVAGMRSQLPLLLASVMSELIRWRPTVP
jgi:hypothetical protein